MISKTLLRALSKTLVLYSGSSQLTGETHLFSKVTLIQCDKGCKQEATLRVGLGKLAQIPDRGAEKQKPGVQGGWGNP